MDPEHAAALKRRYLIDFEADTLRSRPLWVRMIIEFLGTFMLVTVAITPGATPSAGQPRSSHPARS
jgi:aquaporin Z